MLYMATFNIHIPPMLAYIPYMDPMGMFFGNPPFPDTNLQVTGDGVSVSSATSAIFEPREERPS